MGVKGAHASTFFYSSTTEYHCILPAFASDFQDFPFASFAFFFLVSCVPLHWEESFLVPRSWNWGNFDFDHLVGGADSKTLSEKSETPKKKLLQTVWLCGIFQYTNMRSAG